LIKIKTQLKEFKAELGRLGVEVEKLTPAAAQPRKKIEALEKKHKFKLPAPLKDFYLKSGGHFIAWSVPGADIAGSSSVVEVNTFFTNRTIAFRDGQAAEGSPYYSKYLDEEQGRTLDEDYFLFERVYVDTFVLVSRKESGADDAALYLLEHPFKLTRLDLTFEGYLEKLFEHRALLNWQQQYKQGGGDAALLAKFNEDEKALLSGPPPVGRKGAAGSYRARLDELVARLRSNKQLGTVEFEERGSPPPVNVFRKIEQTFKSELPEAFVNFYREVNGFKLVWHTAPGATPAAFGVIDIPPLEEAFGGRFYKRAADWDDYVTYGVLWDDELREAFQDDFRAVQNKRLFDRHLSRNQILLEPQGGGVKIFYYVDRGVIPLEVGFGELLDMMFDTAGVEYYPALLIPRDKAAESRDRALLDELTEKAKIVNPAFARR